ncbi:hypothetical protein BVI1335_1260011 [Burkholderia vietnamiensis]|nr:hypothetical protein BVI1335_1260011 [Burkholderia vietnamiensis]
MAVAHKPAKRARERIRIESAFMRAIVRIYMKFALSESPRRCAPYNACSAPRVSEACRQVCGRDAQGASLNRRHFLERGSHANVDHSP